MDQTTYEPDQSTQTKTHGPDKTRPDQSIQTRACGPDQIRPDQTRPQDTDQTRSDQTEVPRPKSK